MSKRTHRRLRDRILRRRDELVPPRSVDAAGPAAFVADGEEYLRQAVTGGGLLPQGRVLDIGCGAGTFARPLTGFLSPEGVYEGFDVSEQAIAWCQERYAPFPQFHFQRADLFNMRYHPEGTQQASEFDFPFPDASFELAFAASVLTHLVTAEAERYVREAARVLVPGGRALLNLFLLDLGSRAAITQGRATVPFDLETTAGPMVLVDPEMPEEAVAFDHHWLDEVAAAAGLRRVDAQPGSWRGALSNSHHDLVVLEKTR